MNTGKSIILRCVNAFRDAFHGLLLAFKSENNLRIHFLAVIIVTAAGIFLTIDYYEWLTILILFAIVITTELLNTSIEKLSDFVQPEMDEHIRKIKDISAGAVLWSSIIAALAGILIFIPKMYLILTNT